MFLNPSAASWRYDGRRINPEVVQLHQLLPDYNITPLISLPGLAEELGLGHVLLKDESNRFGLPAFKILGASWAIYKALADGNDSVFEHLLQTLGEKARANGTRVVACTEGNWGRAVARMVGHT